VTPLRNSPRLRVANLRPVTTQRFARASNRVSVVDGRRLAAGTGQPEMAHLTVASIKRK
jgi:hypothetical protein